MSFRIVEKQDLTTGEVFFYVHHGSTFKKRFATKAAAKAYIEEREFEIMMDDLAVLLDSTIVQSCTIVEESTIEREVTFKM